MPTTIAILGATGSTGASISRAFLDLNDSPYHLISLTRPASVSKPANQKLAAQGVEIRGLDITSPHSTLVTALRDVDVLISTIAGVDELLQQIPLATAAKEAGVKRFFPSAWLPIIPAGGLHILRDLKEQVYNHVKQLGLGYTIVDIGWWYQISFPKLPSGKIDYAVTFPLGDQLWGSGRKGSALTHLGDVGRYVVRAVQDERTENKYVLVYNEVWSQDAIFSLMEKLSGEELPRTYVSAEECEAAIMESQALLDSGLDWHTPEGMAASMGVIGRQYPRSWGIRGDNTPENAKFLGYVTSQELWPEMEFLGYEDYLKEVIEGKAATVYEERKDLRGAAAEVGGTKAPGSG